LDNILLVITEIIATCDKFSEDIDIALKREDRFAISSTSNSQLAKARRTARHYIVRELPIELSEALTSLGIKHFHVEPDIERTQDGQVYELRADTHPSVVYINYTSVIPEISEYIQPKIKVELSCLSMDEPVQSKILRSFISEEIPEAEDLSLEFNTVLPTRTFLEKMFLLHEEFQKEKPRSYRMSRHLYDLEKIMNSPFGNSALADKSLYLKIVEHRNIFNHIPYIDYTKHDPSTIRFIPPAKVMSDWKDDYNNMQTHFIYDDNTLSYDILIERIKTLQERIRKM
jgi:hypothetical protein